MSTCFNRMILTHDKHEALKNAIDLWNENKFLETLIPEPNYQDVVVYDFAQNPVDLQNAQYFWRLRNWGVKHDIGKTAEIDMGTFEGIFAVDFESPWTPPINAYKNLEKKGFKVEAFFYEPKISYAGRYFQGIEEKFDVKDNSPNWVKSNLPRYIAVVIEHFSRFVTKQ